MTDQLNHSIEVLGSKIDELAVHVGSLSGTVSRVERSIELLASETREQRLVAEKQAENIQSLSASIAQLIALAQQQQATVDRLLSKN